MAQLYMLIAGLVVVGLMGVGVMRAVDSYNGAFVRAEKAEAEAKGLREDLATKDTQLKKRQQQFDDAEEAARQRGARERDSNAKLEDAERRLAELRNSNPTVAAFLAQPVPELLREPRTAGTQPARIHVQPSDGGPGASEPPSKN